MLPLAGVSILDGDGQLFCDRDADNALFQALKDRIRSDIPVVEVEANINDPAFAAAATEKLIEMIHSTKKED